MFKNIQKKLLINHPLLWNTKIVPFVIIGIILHILFFTFGYIKGELNFQEPGDIYRYRADDWTTLFFTFIVSTLVVIVWLVLYARNNGFKSFYTKNNFSLFKEWLIILLFFIVNSTFAFSYMFAKDVRARSYFTKEETLKRCDVLSKASIFLNGTMNEQNYYEEDVVNEKGDTVVESRQRDSFMYNSRKYSLNSLLNKRPDTFSNSTKLQDSLREKLVKSWLINNKKDSIEGIFNDFFKIANEHHLKGNITSKKWLELTYNYPEFTDYIVVGKSATHNYYNDEYSEYTEVADSGQYPIDTLSQEIRIVNGMERIYSKYHVPYEKLHASYVTILRAYEDPDSDLEFGMFFIYIAFGFSIAVFSFKVTSGKSWLIAFVSLGIIGIIAGLASAFSRYDMTFPIIYLFYFGILVVYFLIIINSKTTKGISDITLNQLLWMIPAFVPLLYIIVLEIVKEASGYNDYNYTLQPKNFPNVEFMKYHIIDMLALNFLAVIIFMLIMSVQIKKWKGISES